MGNLTKEELVEINDQLQLTIQELRRENSLLSEEVKTCRGTMEKANDQIAYLTEQNHRLTAQLTELRKSSMREYEELKELLIKEYEKLKGYLIRKTEAVSTRQQAPPSQAGKTQGATLGPAVNQELWTALHSRFSGKFEKAAAQDAGHLLIAIQEFWAALSEQLINSMEKAAEQIAKLTERNQQLEQHYEKLRTYTIESARKRGR